MARPLPTPTRTPHQARHLLLRHLYDRSLDATSKTGKLPSHRTAGILKRELKAAHGFTQSETISSLTYLVSERLVDAEVTTRPFTTKGGVQINNSTDLYAISSDGIHKVEGESSLTVKSDPMVNITASGGNNVITTGNQNSIRAKFESSADALANLQQAIREELALNEDKKADALAEIQTIQAQLLRREPRASTVKGSWELLSRLDTVGSLGSYVAAAATQLLPLLG